MKQKWWSIFLAIVLMFTVAACGSSTSESGAKGNEPAKSNEPAKANEPSITDQAVKLVLVSDGGDGEGVAVVEDLKKKFPKWTFEFINADEDKKGGKAALINAGQQMDIDFDSIGSISKAFLNYELQDDLSELLKKHQVDLNRFDKSMIEAMRQMTGYVFGLPVSNSTSALYYNKDIFDKFGVPYPKDNMTWEEVYDLAKKVSRNDGGKYIYGISFSDSRQMNSNQASLAFVDAKAKKPLINSGDAWSKYLQTVFLPIKDIPGIKEARVAANSKTVPNDNDFYKGDVAMIVYNLGLSNLEKVPFSWDMVTPPSLKEKPGITLAAYPTYYSVVKTSKNKDAAIEAIKYLTSDEYQMEKAKMGTLPTVVSDAVKKSYALDTKFKDKHWQAIQSTPAAISVKSLWDKNIEKAYKTAINTVLFDGVDLNTALRTAEENAAKEIK